MNPLPSCYESSSGLSVNTRKVARIWISIGVTVSNVEHTPRSDARPILESGRRNADRFHGELFVAYVRQPNLTTTDTEALEANLHIARELGATIKVLDGAHDPVRALVYFARETGITQIFIGHSLRKGGGIAFEGIRWND